MNTYLLTISSPDGNLLKEEVTGLFLRGAEGDLAILAGHIPFVTTVKAGECKVEFPDASEKKGYTEGGLLVVSNEGTSLLSGTFRWE